MATAAPAGAPKKLVFQDEDQDDKTQAEATQKPNDQEKEDDLQRLADFLKYFVTPSYLRKSVFGDLKPFECAKKLPKLPNIPSLVASNSAKSQYVEGLSVPRKVEKSSSKSKKNSSSSKSSTNFVNIGQAEYLELAKGVKVPVNARVIVDTKSNTIVTPLEAYGEAGITNLSDEIPNWTSSPSFGYTVRTVTDFGSVFTECPHKAGYKFTAWVPCSEFAVSASTKAATDAAVKQIKAVTEKSLLAKQDDSDETATDPTVPVLLVLGKWKEVVSCISADTENLKDLESPESLFDGRVRVNRATRVEDAAMIALAKMDGI